MVENPPANAGDGLMPGLGRFHGEKKWLCFLVFLPEKSQGQRSLVGSSLESGTT